MLAVLLLALGAVEPPPPEHAVDFRAHAALLQGAARRLSPDGGFGFAVGVRTRVREALGLVVGAEVDLGHDRFVDGTTVKQPFSEHDRSALVVTSFSGLVTVAPAAPWRVRPWAGAGGGVAIGHYTFRAPDPAADRERRAVLPVVRAAGGVEVGVAGPVSVAVRAAYSWYRTGEEVDVGAERAPPFGDVLTIALGGAYAF